MLDRILEIGVNEHGFFYEAVNPISGEPVLKRIADNFGYTYNGFYSVYLVDNVEAYRTAARETIANLYQHYKSYRWEGASSDGYADAIEGALNLYNREPIPSVADWIDSEIHVMWNKQRKNGVIEGWHGDGNFARTTVMYCLWKSQGTSAHPWREDLVLGAVEHKGSLRLCLTAEADWEGKIHFDSARHKTNFNLPLDWPRINQFPEWFTADADQVYAWKNATTGETKSISGQVLLSGVDVKLKAGERLNISIEMP